MERPMTAPLTSCHIALNGGGLFGSIVALAFARLRPEISFVLFESDQFFGGDRYEIAFHDRMAVSMPLLEPAIVNYWTHCYRNLPGQQRLSAKDIFLIDPGQLHLEVLNRIPPMNLACACSILSISGGEIVHSKGRTFANIILDLRDASFGKELGLVRSAKLRDAQSVHHLDAPMLIDAGAFSSQWDYLQLVPVGESHLLVDHISGAGLPSPRKSAPPFVNVSMVDDAGMQQIFSPQPSHWADRLAARLVQLPDITSATVSKIAAEERQNIADELKRFFAAFGAAKLSAI